MVIITAITWTNDNLAYWCIYAIFGLNWVNVDAQVIVPFEPRIVCKGKHGIDFYILRHVYIIFMCAIGNKKYKARIQTWRIWELLLSSNLMDFSNIALNTLHVYPYQLQVIIPQTLLYASPSRYVHNDSWVRKRKFLPNWILINMSTLYKDLRD